LVVGSLKKAKAKAEEEKRKSIKEKACLAEREKDRMLVR
jgi:hypothetical protein